MVPDLKSCPNLEGPISEAEFRSLQAGIGPDDVLSGRLRMPNSSLGLGREVLVNTDGFWLHDHRFDYRTVTLLSAESRGGRTIFAKRQEGEASIVKGVAALGDESLIDPLRARFIHPGGNLMQASVLKAADPVTVERAARVYQNAVISSLLASDGATARSWEGQQVEGNESLVPFVVFGGNVFHMRELADGESARDFRFKGWTVGL